jgi:signal transduction histidine kinase
MGVSTNLLIPPFRPRRRTRSARLRITLMYAGLFLLMGTIVLAITYVLTGQSSPVHISVGAASTGATAVRHKLPIQFTSVGPLADAAAQQRQLVLARLLTVSWLVLAITTVGAALLGWFAAGRVLRPVRSITATARTISAGNLHERLALTGPNDEFRALGDTLDDLLARLEASFEAQRRFVANASHELRTPLTLERALLQVALADPDASAQALRTTGEELLELQAEHERMLEALLTLASSERGLDRREPVDLPGLAEGTLSRFGSAIENRDLTLETSLNPATTTGDPALVERLIANLIDNAVDHNVPHGRLEVRTGMNDGGEAMLMVSSTGPPIPPEEVERLFEPFQRLDRTRANQNGHHGLGLSIVRAIVTAHGADLAAEARPGGGLTVTVRFLGTVGGA